jgi:hypothetical protein
VASIYYRSRQCQELVENHCQMRLPSLWPTCRFLPCMGGNAREALYLKPCIHSFRSAGCGNLGLTKQTRFFYTPDHIIIIGILSLWHFDRSIG